MCCSDVFLGLIAILFPPLAVWVKRGICSADSLINILLCMLGFIPGLLHAWYIIAKFPDPYDSYESLSQNAEEGRVTYIIVQGPNGEQRRVKNTGGRQEGNGRGEGAQQGYGATAPMAPRVGQASDGTWGTGQQEGGVVNGSGNAAGEGSSDGAVPPTYAEAVKGDHKVQTRD